jgi:hypothetical protein
MKISVMLQNPFLILWLHKSEECLDHLSGQLLKGFFIMYTETPM